MTASARRDDIWITLPAVELVQGDVVKLSLGAIVPADARLINGSVLIDQSMPTGESVPIEAGAGFTTYAGALIRRSEAIAEIVDDSAALVGQLHEVRVRTVIVTGDAPVTARVVAGAVKITGPLCPNVLLLSDVHAEDFGVFAGVMPEDQYALVQALQRAGHIVGMCGDGANDAPALRQAQIGIAVFTATDVAKSAAGIVLTEPGLGGIVATVMYTFRSIVRKIVQVLFLLVGLVICGTGVLTPLLMVLVMVAGDFFALTSATDNVRASSKPNVWRAGSLTIAGIILGMCVSYSVRPAKASSRLSI